jgi:apolipoprotein N-acyltransferase
MRAVEEGLALVRVANSGISAIVDPYGRTVASLGLGRQGFIDGDLPAALVDPTSFARLGNIIVLLLSILLAGAAFLMPKDIFRSKDITP